MKRKVIIGVFSALIFITAICFASTAIALYKADIQNGVDILEGFGAAMTVVLGGFVIFYELDLFHTVYYFFVKPKTVAKSVLNVLANGCLLLMLAYGRLSDICMELRAFEQALYVLFFIYLVLRMVYFAIFMVSTDSSTEEG